MIKIVMPEMHNPASMLRMNIKHYPAEKLKKEILSVVGKYLNLNAYRVFFFGSRVTGGGDDRSDIDVGIEGPAGISSETMFKIKEDVEKLPLLYKIDVVDFKTVSEDFKSVALSKIEVISND